MPYRDLLVQVDETKRCAERLKLAAELARQWDSHLVGVYAAPTYNLSAYLAGQVPPEILEAHQEMVRRTIERLHKEFEEIASAAGAKYEWRDVEGDPAEVFSLHARYVDLAVVGQADPDDDSAEAYRSVPEEVALASGRPILVVPYAGRFETVGRRVTVAWNASREAARAVNDALPILQQAERVVVLAINPKSGNNGHGDIPGADIALHLARHGVKAEAARVVAEDIDVGNILLSRVADEGSDLIVMGAYGRSRLREVVLGGASRDVLRHMTVPVLMSH